MAVEGRVVIERLSGASLMEAQLNGCNEQLGPWCSSRKNWMISTYDIRYLLCLSGTGRARACERMSGVELAYQLSIMVSERCDETKEQPSNPRVLTRSFSHSAALLASYVGDRKYEIGET